MISGRSTSTSKAGTTPIAKKGSSARSRDNLSLDIPPLPLAASDVASSNHPDSTKLPALATLDVAHGSTFDGNDIIIAVMGATGAGKSSFVHTAAGRAEVMVGPSLNSRMRPVKPVRCPHPDGRRNIVLVDTPGFNDTYLSDAQILKMIAHWLRETYQKNIKLAGILYLHRISDVRMSGTPLKNLAVFKDLCGEGNMKNIILVTTMWDFEDASVALQREEELRSTYWRDMIHLGSQTCRYLGTHASAWQIIERLNLEGPRHTRQPLQIQREMVDHRMRLQETAAAKTLFRILAAKFKKVWERSRSGARKTRPSAGMSAERRPRRVGSASSLRSGSSKASWSIFSTSTLSNSSYHSPGQFSPAESISLGCSAHGRRDTLFAMIQGLTLAHQMADTAGASTLRGAISTVLQLAKTIEGMGGAHHMIGEVVEYSGCLLEEIAQSTGSGLSKDMRKTLSLFRKELRKLQKIVNNISTRNTASRFFLRDADIQVIMSCTSAIRATYDKLEISVAMDNLEAIARLEAQITKLCDTQAPSRQCECGRFIVQEESRESGHPSMSPIARLEAQITKPYHAPSLSSPVESTSSTCSSHGRRDAPFATIQGLALAYQMAHIAAIPTLRGAIGTVLQLAKTIQGMGGTHHMIEEVVGYSACLLGEIAQCTGTRLPKDMRQTLSSFRKELRNLQNNISTRDTACRLFLHDADIQAITACTTAIAAIYDRLEVTVATDNLEAVVRLEARIKKLCDTQAPLRQCKCGRLIVQEYPRECGQPPTSQSL